MDSVRVVQQRTRRRCRLLRRLNWGMAVGIVVATAAMIAGSPALAVGEGAGDWVKIWGFAAAALSTAVGALGAAYAVGHVGAAALGAIGERPEIAGRALIFVGLAEGIAIYGLIVSIMILGRLG